MSYQPTPTQPFHQDLNPVVAVLVDDFLEEIDQLLRKVRDARHQYQRSRDMG